MRLKCHNISPILQTADAIVSMLEHKVEIMTDTLLRERVNGGGEGGERRM